MAPGAELGHGGQANGFCSGLTDGDRNSVEGEVEAVIEDLLDALRIDWRNDPNTMGTPARVARMYVREVFRGRFEPPPKLTDFPNVKGFDQLYTVGPITVRSACSHHLVPIVGRAWVGVLPSERVIGLSKFSRLADWVMARPQLQEEATVQLADMLERAIRPEGLGVVVQARHLCMTWRGVKDPATDMVTTILRGRIQTESALQDRFFSTMRGLGAAL